jgi:Domain of unknown function (DUF4375)
MLSRTIPKMTRREIEDIQNPRIRSLSEALDIALSYNGSDPKQRLQWDHEATYHILQRIWSHLGPKNHGEHVVDAVLMLQGEVFNGGFYQYFANSSGGNGEKVKLYLREIGAIKTLGLLERASRVFPDGIVPKSRRARNNIMEQNDPDMDLSEKEDTEFYTSDENLTGLLLTYVRSHQRAFRLPTDDVIKRFKRSFQIQAHYGQIALKKKSSRTAPPPLRESKKRG